MGARVVESSAGVFVPAIALAILLATSSGCDRDRESSIEPSDTAQTSPPVARDAQPAVTEPRDRQTPIAPARDPCAGLMDDALQDCRSQNIEASRNAADSPEEQVTTP